MEYKNIIFDFGGVLINWNPKFLYRKIFETEEEVDYFLESVCTMDWNVQQDAGITWEQGIKIKTAEFPHFENEIKMYWQRWTEMLNGEISGTVKILKEMHQQQNYNLYGLTNWSAETFPFAQQRFNFLKLFKGIVVSGDEKMIKPNPEIYKLLLKRYNLIAEECIFIDDNLKNINAANDLGISGIHFKDAEQLKLKLKELKIKLT